MVKTAVSVISKGHSYCFDRCNVRQFHLFARLLPSLYKEGEISVLSIKEDLGLSSKFQRLAD